MSEVKENEYIANRIRGAEVSIVFIQDDIKVIKITLRWALGLVFALNSAIIGLLAKGFNII